MWSGPHKRFYSELKIEAKGRAAYLARPFGFAVTRQEGDLMGEKTKKKGSISYAKWGYIFIAPFFIIFAVFQLIPLASTIYYSFFEYYRSGLKIIGPNFVGLKNYITLFATDLPKYFSNTLILWIIGFIPQIVVSLLLAAWFTDLRLKLKGQTFFKTVIYMPNLIMASAFAMLFFALFSDNGPVNAVLLSMGWIKTPISFLNTVWGNRGLVGLMNFLMWFGNTTIMLMAAIMGVDPTLYEAAELDGCTPNQMFWKITLPLIRPILVYVMITSMIGGLQMFDVPQILTNGKGGPDRTSTTMIMYLNNHLFSKNYGMAGAVSVVLFLVCAVLCVVVYFSLMPGKSIITNFRNVLTDANIPVVSGIRNSLLVSACSAALSVYFSALTAYGIYAYNFKFKKAAFALILLIMTMPTQVSALGFLQLISKMGLKNSFIPLIVPSIAAPTVFFFMKQYLDASLPMEIVEAARIDGAGEFYTFNKIVLPIMKPALAVQAIFSFVASWNNYFIPALVLDTADKKTLPILIAQLRSADFLKFDMGKVYMMVAIAILPVIIVYLLLSKFIVRGVALGGVKG